MCHGGGPYFLRKSTRDPTYVLPDLCVATKLEDMATGADESV
jgi:hypothetical protein